MNCVCVPWGDGGRSSITNVLRTVCTMLRSDSDTSVASTALSTLCACDAFTTPRAPPLLIPTRDSMNNASHMTASSMLQGMKDSKQEMLASKEAKEERKKKLDKNSSKKKKAKKEDTNDDSKLTAEKTDDDADSKVAEAKATKSEEPITNNVPTQSANTSDKMEESSAPPTDKMAVSEVESPNAEKIDTEPMIEDQEEPSSDKVPVETTDASEPNDIQMNEEDDGGGDEEDNDSDDGSFDFPEIVDGDPDEEDR